MTAGEDSLFFIEIACGQLFSTLCEDCRIFNVEDSLFFIEIACNQLLSTPCEDCWIFNVEDSLFFIEIACGQLFSTLHQIKTNQEYLFFKLVCPIRLRCDYRFYTLIQTSDTVDSWTSYRGKDPSSLTDKKKKQQLSK